jgi:hypothetical protein
MATVARVSLLIACMLVVVGSVVTGSIAWWTVPPLLAAMASLAWLAGRPERADVGYLSPRTMDSVETNDDEGEGSLSA